MSSTSVFADSSYSSGGEEVDSEADDPDRLLGQWLHQLQTLEQGLESNTPCQRTSVSSTKLTIPAPRMDTYRFSMANMEASQDVELDAILGELCALEDKLDREMMGQPATHRRSHDAARPRFHVGGPQVSELCVCDGDLKAEPRTDSPDNDSAFSDSVSMLSSESSASSSARGEGPSSRSSCMSLASSPTQAEQAARMKAEKIKIALEKMKEASVKKLFIKAFSADHSAKSLLIDERMRVGQVCRLLAEKNHVPMDPRWALVEHLPHLHLERVYEDHELVVENLLLWTRDSSNRLYFLERQEKYDLFRNPQDYLLGGTSSEKDTSLDDEAKNALVDEFFSSNVGVPEVEGHLHLKTEGKKAWKKHFFVLRASGLYYCPKGKSKFSKDLLCLTTFDMNDVYLGFGWKKKFKAPCDAGFAIKHPQIQTKSSKYIKYLCAEDEGALKQWIMGIRIAKYGSQLRENYDALQRDLAEEDLDYLATARAGSVANFAAKDTPPEPPTTLDKMHKLKVISRRDSVKSSRSTASTGSGAPLAFDADFPVGTIKRKPANLPLTPTTRNLAKQSGGDEEEGQGSLGRSTYGRFSLRRSHTDDRISLASSLSRRKHSVQETPISILMPDLPLPPPPPELPDDALDCLNFDTLPPPPPEAFRNGTLEKTEEDWKTDLPPPLVTEVNEKSPAIPPKPRKGVRRRQSESDARGEHRLVVVRPRHKLRLELDSADSADDLDGWVGGTTTPSPSSPTSPRHSAADRKSRSHSKPSPPKRSEHTKLSSQQPPPRRSSSASAAPSLEGADDPPESFLRNLQKVMVRKWKMAQQLSGEGGVAAHPVILGFRDPGSLPERQESPPPPPVPVHGRPTKNPKRQHSKKTR